MPDRSHSKIAQHVPHNDVDGPFVVVACLANQAATEFDGTLLRIEGFVTGIIVEPPFDEALRANFVLAVMFNAGSTTISRTLNVWGTPPDGLKELVAEGTIHFSGGGSYANSVTPISIPVNRAGMMWFDVELDEALMSRFAVRISHESVSEQVHTA